MIFNGADAAEIMTVTTQANGGFQFFRNVGNITVDTTNVERVEVDGLGGNDSIDGSAQTNTAVALEITGGAGNDTLTGGAGNDTLIGGAGNDSLTGSAGADAFVFGAETANGVTETDLIVGYSEAEGDVIDLRTVGAVVDSQCLSEPISNSPLPAATMILWWSRVSPHQ